ncbi:hypothetical protein BH09SUM1_BH09SUM1_13470 [soil metagenome]
MNVLSLDLDFFLDRVHLWRGEGRLNSAEYHPWTEHQVRSFLEDQCGLSESNPVPGFYATHHDAAFHYWRRLIDRGRLAIPFDVAHLDAHADLGVGDDSYEEIMGELLHLPPGERAARITRLDEGNFLAYAAACRWTSSITFVTPPAWKGKDANFLHFRDFDERTGLIEMRAVDPEHLRAKMAKHDYFVTAAALEPTIPYRVIGSSEYRETEHFDFVFLCQSPEYTPVESDALISIIRGYFAEDHP